jgi:iron complex transport system ATP-binding protein
MDRRNIIAETLDLEIGYHSRGKINSVMQHISLQAGVGELVALIGRNGTGKSTLLRTLVALQPALGGRIKIKGEDLQNISNVSLPKTISFTSTEPMAVRNIRVHEAVALGRFPYTNWIGTLTPEDEDIIGGAMEVTGITPLADRRIDSISDGERQRTLIARSLAQDTSLLVMDEPTAFLDLPSRYSIVSLLRRLTREKGKSVVYSTHDLDTAINEADRIWLMTGGGIADGAPEDLILTGTIEKAFESPMLAFSSTDGTFSFVRDRKTAIALEGEGPGARLTEKALNRCGYAIDQNASLRVKMIEGKGERAWLLVKGTDDERFTSLYDLLHRLSDEPHQ